MNSVDTVIKNYMLAEPVMFPTRFSVLSYLMLNPNNEYYWNNKGAAACVHGMPRKTDSTGMQVHLGHLAERIQSMQTEARYSPASESTKFRVVQLQAEKAKLEHLAQNIDTYVECCYESDCLPLTSIDMLRYIDNVDNTLLGMIAQTPKINTLWGAAAQEVLRICLASLKDAQTSMGLPRKMAKIQSQLQAIQLELKVS